MCRMQSLTSFTYPPDKTLAALNALDPNNTTAALALAFPSSSFVVRSVPAGVAAIVRATDTADSKFWILDSDALRNYDKTFLLSKRKAYASLESKIQERLNNFTSFIVLCTTGIEKSFFGYHWIIRLGQMGKVGEVVYILNLRSRCVEGGYDVNGKIICKMLDDPSMWLARTATSRQIQNLK
ncbi:hypothetical protein SELMODRAFT_424583 [Selaginella moellendorffii]|uniref:Uncharacterized protein n=1 Tax=Selaginella moellendorffii TaxID=88036 RepID=D8SQD5_SELML|nr:hypothetical protein SELMODRAFT_424583 [Selaginella moellendorffii]